MGLWLRRIGMLVGGFAAVAIPFFVTLKIIDHVAERAVPAGKPIFSLIMSPSGNNWSIGESKTRVDAKPTGISLVMPSGEPGFGFRTDWLRSAKGRTYAVVYDINVASGTLSLGIVEGTAVKLERLSAKTGRVNFVARSDDFMIALYNRGSSPATATIAALSVLEH